MDESSLIQELKSKVGVESPPKVYEIEKGILQRFVRAIDDPNPLWQDEEYAQKSRYSGIIAPPTFIPVIGFGGSWHLLPSFFSEGSLHGSTELECYQPVRVGDTITVTDKLVDVREWAGKETGKTVFITLETTYRNQRQELVAKCRQMLIRRIEGK